MCTKKLGILLKIRSKLGASLPASVVWVCFAPSPVQPSAAGLHASRRYLNSYSHPTVIQKHEESCAFKSHSRKVHLSI